MRQAILNLLNNAIKFTEKGYVRIVASFLPEIGNGQPAVQVDVMDTGIGIAQDALPNLFQSFSQGDVSVSRKYGGTGLGLAISRHIANLLGGSLTARSELGRGSTFTLTIPTGSLVGVAMLQNPSEAIFRSEAKPRPLEGGNLENTHILLAEDGIDNRDLIQTVLQKAGATVKTAENGSIAVEMAAQEPFDVILIDINMPVMDGYEATRILRDLAYSGPIIALTANAMIGDRERCKIAGCDDYLTKPINRELLIRTVAAYAKHKPEHVEGAAPDESNGSPTVGMEGSVAIGEGTRRSSSTDEHAAGFMEQASLEDSERTLSEFTNEPDMAPIIERFRGRLGAQVEEMRAACANHKHGQLQTLAHKLKGAGGSYGYPQLTDACRVLEESAKAMDEVAEDAALERIAKLAHSIR